MHLRGGMTYSGVWQEGHLAQSPMNKEQNLPFGEWESPMRLPVVVVVSSQDG